MSHNFHNILHISKRAALTILIGSTVSCVSVNIGDSKTEKSSGVLFKAPSGNFKEVENKRADGAWRNSLTGSTIAFQSNCGDTADIPLESISAELFNGFEQARELRSERINFDGREALNKEVEGKVDGVFTRVHAIIYKKNQCSYVLTFIALTKALLADNGNKAAVSGDAAQFEKFTSEFKAP